MKKYLCNLHIEGILNIQNVYNAFENVSCFGVLTSDSTTTNISNCYGINGMAIVKNSTASLDISTCKTFNPTTLTFSDDTTLLTALNAWVNANKQTYLDTYDVELKNWVMGENGYPVFEE